MDPIKYQEQPYRFVILAILLLAVLVSNLHTNNFSAIASLVESSFSLPPLLVSLNYLATLISQLVFMVPINWLITKQGLRVSCYLAATGIVLGVWLRTTLSTANPYLCIIGSFLSATSSMILGNSSSKILVNWFRADIFTHLIYIYNFFSILSSSAGLFLPGLLLNSSSSQQEVIGFLRIIAIIITVPFLLLALLIREKPLNPPSRSADFQQKMQTKEYLKILKTLFRNKNYLKLIAVACCTLGSTDIYLSIISNCLKTLDYSQPAQIIAQSDITMLVSGVLGTIFYALFLSKLKRYQMISVVLNILTILGYFLLNFGLAKHYQELWQIILISAPLGLNSYSLGALFVSYASQIAFPVDQASIFGYLIGIAHGFGFLAGLAFVPFSNRSREDSIVLLSILGGMHLLGLAFNIIVKEDLRKDKFEQGQLSEEALYEGNQDVEQVKKRLIKNSETSHNVLG